MLDQHMSTCVHMLTKSMCLCRPEDPWGLSAFRINAGTNAGRSDLGSDPRLPTQLQWARHLANGDIAALILNRDNATQHAALKFADFLPGVAGGAYHVRDLQARKDLGVKCQVRFFDRNCRRFSTICR